MYLCAISLIVFDSDNDNTMGNLKTIKTLQKDDNVESILKDLKDSLEVLSSDDLRSMRNSMYQYLI